VSEDPRALKLYIDGSSYKNPGGAGGFACVAEYPEGSDRPDEIVFEEGYAETNISRMELSACIRAMEYVAEQSRALGVTRVQVITDSLYVYGNYKRPTTWRHDKWCNRYGKPIENADLWKRFLTVQGRLKVRWEIIWRKGKKTPILKMVDKAAKAAGKSPTKVDRGFRAGKVARSKVLGGSSSLYPAHGQEVTVRVYRTGLIRKIHHKIHFDAFDDVQRTFTEKYTAYAQADVASELHRGHCYRVRFNTDVRNPSILEILEEVPSDTCKPEDTAVEL
jgi:ribonuclease HI